MAASRPGQIATGAWQRVAGAILLVLGVFAALASEVRLAALLLALAGPLLFWGTMLGYFHLIEAKIDALADIGRSTSDTALMTQSVPPVFVPAPGENKQGFIMAAVSVVAIFILVSVLVLIGR